MIITINGLEDTNRFGEKLGTLLEAGDVICLNGDLGAGKTTLSQAIGKGLLVSDYITSPTFTLIHEYEGRLKVYHFDVYRLNSGEELFDLGIDDYFFGKGVSLIEWAENIRDFLPKERLELWIDTTDGDDNRIIYAKAYGSRYDKLLEELKK